MATQPKRSETKPLEGAALARAMTANPELVAASNEAKRRADAGEPGILIRASALKAWLNDKRLPRPTRRGS